MSAQQNLPVLSVAKDRRGMAIFSGDDHEYRYVLTRRLVPFPKPCQRRIMFVMLNPSVADEFRNDNTITRCVDFATNWGFEELVVTNLFALVSTNPAGLLKHKDPVGPKNNHYLSAYASEVEKIVCAWGANADNPKISARAIEVVGLLRAAARPELYCLGKTVGGQPVHPLRLAKKTQLVLL